MLLGPHKKSRGAISERARSASAPVHTTDAACLLSPRADSQEPPGREAPQDERDGRVHCHLLPADGPDARVCRLVQARKDGVRGGWRRHGRHDGLRPGGAPRKIEAGRKPVWPRHSSHLYWRGRRCRCEACRKPLLDCAPTRHLAALQLAGLEDYTRDEGTEGQRLAGVQAGRDWRSPLPRLLLLPVPGGRSRKIVSRVPSPEQPACRRRARRKKTVAREDGNVFTGSSPAPICASLSSF